MKSSVDIQYRSRRWVFQELFYWRVAALRLLPLLLRNTAQRIGPMNDVAY